MKRKLSLLLVLIMVLSVAVMAGCQDKDTGTDGGIATTQPTTGGSAPTTTDSAAPVPEGPKSIIARQASIPNVLDNYTAITVDCGNIEGLIYNFVLGTNPEDMEYQLEDGVLESYDVKTNADGSCTMTLTMRDDIYFHNGDKLTADDLIYSIECYRDLATTGKLVYTNMTSISSEGNVVTVQLSKPHALLLNSLKSIRVQNKKYFEELGDVDAYAKANGTGPYKLAEFIPGGSVKLEAWADYHDGKRAIDNITFLRIDELNAAYMSLEAGDIDLTEVTAANIDRARGNDDLFIIEKQSGYTYEMLFNCESERFSNLEMRKAFAYALNKEGYMVLNENFTLNDSAHPKIFETYYSAPDQIKYDPEKAKAAFEALGVTPTNRMAVEFTAHTTDPLLKPMEAYQIDLKSYGVDVSIVTLEFGAWVDHQHRGDYEVMPNGWSNSNPSAYALVNYYASVAIGQSNTERYTDPTGRMDEIFAELTITTDRARQLELCKEAQIIAARDIPKYPLYGYTAYFAMAKDITGIKIKTSKGVHYLDADRTAIG